MIQDHNYEEPEMSPLQAATILADFVGDGRMREFRAWLQRKGYVETDLLGEGFAERVLEAIEVHDPTGRCWCGERNCPTRRPRM